MRGYREVGYKGSQGMILLIVVIVSQMCMCVKIHQIVYFNMCCLLHVCYTSVKLFLKKYIATSTLWFHCLDTSSFNSPMFLCHQGKCQHSDIGIWHLSSVMKIISTSHIPWKGLRDSQGIYEPLWEPLIYIHHFWNYSSFLQFWLL